MASVFALAAQSLFPRFSHIQYDAASADCDISLRYLARLCFPSPIFRSSVYADASVNPRAPTSTASRCALKPFLCTRDTSSSYLPFLYSWLQLMFVSNGTVSSMITILLVLSDVITISGLAFQSLIISGYIPLPGRSVATLQSSAPCSKLPASGFAADLPS